MSEMSAFNWYNNTPVSLDDKRLLVYTHKRVSNAVDDVCAMYVNCPAIEEWKGEFKPNMYITSVIEPISVPCQFSPGRVVMPEIYDQAQLNIESLEVLVPMLIACEPEVFKTDKLKNIHEMIISTDHEVVKVADELIKAEFNIKA